jgi:hypothetical protein
MEKEFVPYEQALALKELGFNEPFLGRFYTKSKSKMFGLDEKGRHYPITNTSKKLYTLGEHFVLNGDNAITAPLYQQAFRWFREKYGISVSISINWEEGIGKDSSYGKYSCSLEHKSYDESIGEFIGVFKRYEEAELACLKKLIEIVKEK